MLSNQKHGVLKIIQNISTIDFATTFRFCLMFGECLLFDVQILTCQVLAPYLYEKMLIKNFAGLGVIQIFADMFRINYKTVARKNQHLQKKIQRKFTLLQTDKL